MNSVRAAPVTILLVLHCLVSASSADTLRVELDGSGDYDDPQVAVWNAAPGDTILIGLGRYDTFRDFSLPGWTEPTIIGIDVDDLTIRGTSKSEVIIGPLEGYWDNFGPMGIVQQVGSSGLVVENLTITNVFAGMYLVTDASVHGCVFEDCSIGINAFTAGGLNIEMCEFLRQDDGILAFSPSAMIRVESSQFADNRMGMAFVATNGVLLSDCTVDRGIVGVQFEESTHGTVDECRIEGQTNLCVAAFAGAEISILNSRLLNADGCLLAGSQSAVTGTGNLLRGSAYATLLLAGYSTVDLSNNDLLPDQGHTVRLQTFLAEPTTIDLSGNYWGTTDSSEIEELIWDGNDDPAIRATVEFEPILGQPVPLERQSMGRLKSIFGDPKRHNR